MRKNILILGHNYATQFIDIYNQYASLFDKKHYEVTIAYLTGEPSEEICQRTHAEQIIFFNFPNKHLRTLKWSAIKKVLNLCKENEFELVICHRYKPTYIMLWIAQFYKIPALIFVMHELRTMASLRRQFLITCLKRKNMLFAGVSNAVRDDMRKNLKFVKKKHVTTLYNMIDIEHTEPNLLSRDESRKILNIPNDAFIFGNIARLAPNKDHETLIRAFEKIRSQCENVKLLIIGDGMLELRLQELVASFGLTHDVIFTGFLSKAFQYLRAFDCFVLPSIQEAFGRVLLEASLAKLPIIASHVHGIPEVIKGGGGFLVKPKNIAGLASTMKQIYNLSHDERQKYGEKGYKHTLSNFSLPKFHEQFWQLPIVQSIKEIT